MTRNKSLGHGLLRRRSTAAVVGGLAAVATVLASPALAVPPGNDDIGDAIVIAETPFSDRVDTTQATSGNGDVGCGFATVWYTFTPTTSGVYQLDTYGSDYDTTLALLVGYPEGATLLACNDDSGSLQSRITRDLVAGVTYYVEVGTCCAQGFPRPSGNLVFNVDLPPSPFDVVVKVDWARIGSEPGTAIVSGTATCNNDGYVNLSGTLTQKKGHTVIRGALNLTQGCSVTPNVWTATVVADSWDFLAKPTTLRLDAYGCDEISCDAEHLSRTIKISRR
jgi:hypothetical protein